MIAIHCFLYEGFSAANSKTLKNEIIQVYGISSILIFQNLNKIGIFLDENPKRNKKWNQINQKCQIYITEEQQEENLEKTEKTEKEKNNFQEKEIEIRKAY